MRCIKCGSEKVENEICVACGANCVELNIAKEHKKKANNNVQKMPDSHFLKYSNFMDEQQKYRLAVCLLEGVGMERNIESATKIFLELAHRGDLEAMFKLSDIYEKLNNKKESDLWLMIAAEAGHEPSINKLKVLNYQNTDTKLQLPQVALESKKNVKEAIKNAVRIESCYYTDKKRLKRWRSNGSGFIVEGGYVITNAHVLEGGTKKADEDGVFARFDPSVDEKTFPLEIVKIFTHYDVAVCRFKGVMDEKISKRTTNFKIRTSELEFGEKVYTIGNPMDIGISESAGIISNPMQKFRHRNMPTAIQTNITVYGGNSGGALLDMENNLVGMITYACKDCNSLSFSVHAEYIIKALNSLDKIEKEKTR